MAANWLLGGWTRALHQQDSEVERRTRATSSSGESSPATSPQRKATWPLFETPAISLLRVGGYEIYNGVAVNTAFWCWAFSFMLSLTKKSSDLTKIFFHLPVLRGDRKDVRLPVEEFEKL